MNRIFTLQASPDLADWETIAVLDPRVRNPQTWQVESTSDSFAYLDPAAPTFRQRFYRFSMSAVTSENDWKNQVYFPNDAFGAVHPGTAEEAVRWVKFAILLGEPYRVYYQDSEKYALHHDFATVRLEPFKGMSRAAFDQVSLFRANQQVLLGTVLFPPRDDVPEYGIQFAGRDPYPREMLAQYFERVRSTVVASPDVRAYYFPAYEQSEAAAIDEEFLAARGIQISSGNRWLQGDQVYSTGWALGRVRFVPAQEIDAAYADGRLGPQDILLTDGVPAEIPFVAGIITLTPATPNSHVAILASAYGVPFVYLANSSTRARIEALVGKEIVLQGTIKAGFGQIQAINVDGTLDPAMQVELLALKVPPAPAIMPKTEYGAFSAPVDDFTLADTRFFGGKAANLGLLRRVIPDNSPPAIAFSFDLWDAFMDQTLPGGKTLRAKISERLSPYAYPPDMAALRSTLAEIQRLITQTARFDPIQKETILEALGGFEPARKIRFRSSSNAEDAQTFSAAGLYDSYSGCLADDLDEDMTGPCRCDPTESNERGVFRAIQKVYASFYNENAFLERLRRGVEESQVGMAVLVHYSTPDEIEMANGVATVRRQTPRFGPSYLAAQLVTQAGAVSVANPEGNAMPEVVECAESGSTVLLQPSSLVPLGSHVLQWEADYTTLSEMLFRVYSAYRGAGPNEDQPQDRVLDFEYKKVAPGKLLIKQVREVPTPDTSQVQRYLLNEPTAYWVYQKEGSDVFANHRLKCFLTLQTRDLVLNEVKVAASLYSHATLEFRDGTSVESLEGALDTWPNATHTASYDARRGLVVQDGWSIGSGADQRAVQLTSVIPDTSSPDAPFVPQAEIRKWLNVTYATPVPALDRQGQAITLTNEEIQLVACPDIATLEPGPAETFGTTNGVTFQVAFLSSTNAVGPPMGVDQNLWGDYPAAFPPWSHTLVTGLISQPIELRGYYSQSAQAGHKYRYASYIFEPRLEPELPLSLKQELEDANIRLIHVEREVWPGGQVTVTILGNDGQFRRLGE